ncbi:MAG: hypothetical protein PHN55_12055 [Dysgonamonadaceae bacterium]|nr:hypothetical protein [Dysgonamonadaceae bacterium]
MDWMGIIGIVFGGTSLATVLWSIVYYKPRSRVENLIADEKDIEVAKQAMYALKEVQDDLRDRIVRDREIGQKMEEYKSRLNKQGRSIIDMRSKMLILVEITEKQIERKEFAEGSICTIKGCTLRVPPTGTYKSSSDSVAIKNLKDKLKKGLSNDEEEES